MKRVFVLGLMSVLSAALFSCGAAPTDVYVSGYYTDATTGKDIACYWKNGTQTTLGTATDDSYGDEIYVSGADVYVVGQYYSGGSGSGSHDTACYWKNGTKVDLGDGTSDSGAMVIYVNGANIYVAGQVRSGTFYQAVLWTSTTTKVELGTAGIASRAYGMYKSGDILYIPGADDSKPVYWTYNTVSKAVAKVVISSDPAIAADIFVSGSDIYIAGALGASSMRPVYWKNATATELSSATEYGYAGGIALNGADVYAVGALATSGSQDDMGPVYWKNGVKTALTTAKATAVGSAMRVFVNEGDVYIVGYYTDDLVTPTYEIAAYWKNGTRVDLSPATGKATAVGIFINQQ